MNWIDIVIIIALIVPALIGLWQGFVKTLLSLVGLIVGVIVASNFYEALAGVLTFISNPSIANIVAFIIILLAVMAIAAIIAAVLRAILKAIMLGWADRLAGAVLGFFFGAVFIGGVLAGFAKFFGEGAVTHSLLAGILLDKVPTGAGPAPQRLRLDKRPLQIADERRQSGALEASLPNFQQREAALSVRASDRCPHREVPGRLPLL